MRCIARSTIEQGEFCHGKILVVLYETRVDNANRTCMKKLVIIFYNNYTTINLPLGLFKEHRHPGHQQKDVGIEWYVD